MLPIGMYMDSFSCTLRTSWLIVTSAVPFTTTQCSERWKCFCSESVLPGFEFVKDPVPAFAKGLRRQPGKHIWMMGGGGIIASFLDAGEIDEFIIHVIPVFIGEGIPLIAPRHREVPLRLLSLQRFPDSVVQFHYDVRQSRV